MKIVVKTLTGRKRNIEVSDTTTIEEIKKKLQAKEGITVEQIRLIFAGKQMANERTIGSYDVEAGNMLHMVIALRG